MYNESRLLEELVFHILYIFEECFKNSYPYKINFEQHNYNTLYFGAHLKHQQVKLRACM